MCDCNLQVCHRQCQARMARWARLIGDAGPARSHAHTTHSGASALAVLSRCTRCLVLRCSHRPTFLKWSRNCSTPSSCIDCRKSIAAFFLAWITTAAILAEGPAHPAARCCSASPAVRGRGSGSLTDASRTLAAPQHAGVGTCALTARS